ncbi:MAG: hypothetical protein KDB40_16200 [Acidimicrobiales bacterium]|nr:hypothetical protein [Acidimicrobiales bacterium]MCB9394443.1 hypothetical protein [Acidimicrobiaceae bacterium]
MAVAARQPAWREHAAPVAVPGRVRRRPAGRAVATRRHGALADGPQPLVRATVGIRVSDRHLSLVQPRGRRFTHLAVVATVVIGLAMLGAAAFQTQLADRQVELDRLDREIRSSREQYEVLRRQRAELRSPERLGQIASANGMIPARSSTVVPIGADVIATVVAATGDIDPGLLGDGRTTLDDFRDVKAVTSGDRIDAEATDPAAAPDATGDPSEDAG